MGVGAKKLRSVGRKKTTISGSKKKQSGNSPITSLTLRDKMLGVIELFLLDKVPIVMIQQIKSLRKGIYGRGHNQPCSTIFLLPHDAHFFFSET